MQSSKPKIFVINSTDWWVKSIGMMVHNWALIEPLQNKEVKVFFFHDQGKTKGGGQSANPFKSYNQSNGYIAVVDSLSFDSLSMAKDGLLQNGFKRLAASNGPWEGQEPVGQIYDARKYEQGVYSNGDYWKTIS